MQGAERQVRVPQDLQRFQHLPMLVTFQLQDSNKYALHSVQGRFCLKQTVGLLVSNQYVLSHLAWQVLNLLT